MVGIIFVLLLLFLTWQFVYRKGKIDVDANGKAILVTGAASGIGKATTKMLVEQGCFVYAADINKTELDKLYGKNPNVDWIHLDVTTAESVENMRKCIENKTRGLYGIVNCAGIYCAPPATTIKSTIERDVDSEIFKVIDVNLLGTMRVNHALYELLINEQGCIVNIASVAGRLGAPSKGSYHASKHAVEGYSKSIRYELDEKNVRVVVLEPGFIDTPMLQQFSEIPLDDFDFSQTKFTKRSTRERLQQGRKRVLSLTNPPSLVASEIHRALFTTRLPQTHILVDSRTRKLFWAALSLLPQPIMDWLANRR
eukprot:TRINITY_DN11438_c0_g1_i1.p1 TRINITY_DN11438_c0_g1~~TRINITY_DN11438_c0_g1_i1.p1  ORF type:complete len:311 (-),score=42.01 TRINITY_DN11438_c0_g1_i1:32-964(-)